MSDIVGILERYWGYTSFRPMQREVMGSILEGHDTLALLPTGGGKSLCFQVPALAMGKLCLVVSPLIALMRDQVGRLRKQGIPARAIISGMTMAEIENALDSAVAGKLSFLYVSPERLRSEHLLGRLPRMPLGLIAVDEAHCISQWGYDFRPAYLQIASIREVVPKVPVLALTASATPAVAQDIMDKLLFTRKNVLRGGFARPELALWVSHGEDKHGRLLRILRNVQGTALVYQRERKGTLRTARFLLHHGLDAKAYHAGMSGEERESVQKEWTTGTTRIVVATNAFGMGIDKADVRCVIHMDTPPDPESYYQEAGRAGRDGKRSYAFLLVAPGDEERLKERVIGAFPPLLDIRRVYQAFADMNRVAIGAGEGENYPLDLHAIADRLALPASTVANCLKTLEYDGAIALSEGVRTPSRVFFTTPPSVVYDMRVRDQRLGPLLEILLRMYGGLFEEPSVIDEFRLARLLDWHADTVKGRLEELQGMGMISYKKKSDSPSLTYLRPRADTATLTLDPVAQKERRARAIARMEAMLAYCNEPEDCRMATLLRHFGEVLETPCGECDNCRSTRRRYVHTPQESSSNDAPLELNRNEMDRWITDEKGSRRKEEDGKA